VGFYAEGKLRKIPVEGGLATPLCDVNRITGADWSADDHIVFTDQVGVGLGVGLSMVSAQGGIPQSLTKPDPGRSEGSHVLPSWLPNGKSVLFTVMRHGWDSRPSLALFRLDNGEWDILLQNATDARYLPTGHLVFLREGTLMVVGFDLGNLKITGRPVALVENVMQASASPSSTFNTNAGQFAISDSGCLVYAEGGILPDRQDSLVWVDRRGIEEPVTDLRFSFGGPHLSPDGQKIVYDADTRENQVWIHDLIRGTNRRLTEGGRAFGPLWTPDGMRCVFSWHESQAGNLFWQPYNVSLPMERLTRSPYDQMPGSWSSDGKTLAFLELHPDPVYNWDILLLDTVSRRVTPLVCSQLDEVYPDISPDGRWIAYVSNDSGRREVFVRSFLDLGPKLQVSIQGGAEVLWARNGKELFYRSGDQIWVADVRTDDGLTTTKPRILFEKPGFRTSFPIRNWNLSLDGQRFLMVKIGAKEPTPVTELILIQNWFEELKRLCPAGKE
jgi:serine/threonine-protein kinase